MPYFITKHGQTFGPHQPEEIAVFLNTGEFLAEDYCWQEGWDEWRAISTILSDRPAPTKLPDAVPLLITSPAPPLGGHIPHDVEIVGILKMPDQGIVSGKIEGEIHCPATLIIAGEARVKALIQAQIVIIFGTVDGDIYATGRAVLKSSSILHGNIHAPRMVVEEGALFNGHSQVTGKGPPAAAKPRQLTMDKANKLPAFRP